MSQHRQAPAALTHGREGSVRRCRRGSASRTVLSGIEFARQTRDGQGQFEFYQGKCLLNASSDLPCSKRLTACFSLSKSSATLAKTSVYQN